VHGKWEREAKQATAGMEVMTRGGLKEKVSVLREVFNAEDQTPRRSSDLGRDLAGRRNFFRCACDCAK
jgi:hypothetical protein